MKIRRQQPNNSELSQYTGSQRLVLLYRYAISAKTFSASQFAHEFNIKYHMVYHYLKLLRGMGFPITNIGYGEWQLGNHEDSKFDMNEFMYGGKKFTRAQNLVILYRELIRGQLISPTRYAKKANVSRQTIYHQLDLLSQMGIQVINTRDGWTLTDYL